MNRPLAPGVDGAFVLRPGRRYRLVLLVNGPSSCDELEGVLVRAGFEHPVCSAPGDWEAERPADWPSEPLVATAANECLVRTSGVLRGNVPGVPFARDQGIESGATYTIVAGWDYGEARAPQRADDRVGQAPPTSAALAKSNDTGPRVLAVAAVAGLGLGLWSMWRSSRRYERDEERYASITARAERDELAARVHYYLEHGHARPDAEDMAEREIAAREARKLASELGGGV
jgi:hypothetical protein